ncbi:MAG: phosphoribosylanthranilate isomerase [Puniceicoccaceae bacterium]|nr:MAG: phosphoribosylanthranilate isomerase [Puniceicoccaceae bacterium]
MNPELAAWIIACSIRSMYRRVQIKICGLTREADVDLALSLGADYFGFIVYPKSPRGLSLERAAELAQRVPRGKRVLVDVETGTQELERYREAGFDFFQIHCGLQVGLATLAAWSGLVGADRLWLAPRVAPEDDFPLATLEFAQTLLVDTYVPGQVGGTGVVGDWGRFSELSAAHPLTKWILAGGLGPANVLQALSQTAADHLDINSGVESAPGIKDPAKLREVFQILRPT